MGISSPALMILVISAELLRFGFEICTLHADFQLFQQFTVLFSFFCRSWDFTVSFDKAVTKAPQQEANVDNSI
nr:hypothetical protein [uncultured Cohaesibacter sp.]